MGMSSFGYGQRACLGQSVTRDETVVACGGLLWGFDLKFKKDTSGRLIVPPLDKSNSLLIIKPDRFEMAFEPRSVERKNEILENWRATDLADRAARAAFVGEGAAGTKLSEKSSTAVA